MFNRYQHIEKLNVDETEDITLGTCFLFPKLDGANASVWIEDGIIKAGSRRRELTLDNDNQGFYNTIEEDERVINFFKEFPQYILYGEWMRPHSLKTYRADAWNRFWVFDIVEKDNPDTYIPYDDYKSMLDKYNLDYIPVQTIITNPSEDQLIYELQKNTFLIEDGKGVGEGLVIKNYLYRNKFGRQTWAKLVRSEFKEIHRREMGPNIIEGEKTIEIKIIEKYCTKALIDKVYAKIINEKDSWNSKLIPEFLNRVYYDLINEEVWHIIKEYKFPVIDFKLLNKYVNIKIKEFKNNLF